MLLVVGLLLCAVWGVALGLSAIRMVREGWELWYVLVHVGLLAVSLLAFGAVAVSGDELSRRHAILKREHGTFSITDLDSTNGVFLNGTRVHGAQLYHGDIIQLGDLVYQFREWSGY